MFFARCVHGLEPLVVEELTASGGQIHQTSKRTIVFEAAPDALGAASLRLVDDVYRLVTRTHDPGRSRPDMTRTMQRLDLTTGDVDGSDVRYPRDVSVTASFAGRRRFTRFDVEDAVGSLITRRSGRRYWSRRDGLRPPPGTEEWRVVLDGHQTLVGVRQEDRPLHRRPWRRATVPGSLHPPVAAALVRMAQIMPGDTAIDPCCGAGTLIIEGQRSHPEGRWIGTDIDPRSIRATRANAATAGSDIDALLADSSRLPLREGVADRVVTNPPWNQQVQARGSVRRMVDEWRRVLSDGGVMSVLVDPTQRDIFDHEAWTTVSETPISVAGRHPVLVVVTPDR